jgi:hypothetical protein
MLFDWLPVGHAVAMNPDLATLCATGNPMCAAATYRCNIRPVVDGVSEPTRRALRPRISAPSALLCVAERFLLAATA